MGGQAFAVFGLGVSLGVGPQQPFNVIGDVGNFVNLILM